MIRELALIRREAEAFVRAHFLAPSADPAPTRLLRLRPRPEDYRAVFGAHAEVARALYEPMWATATLAEVSPRAGQTELDVFVADAKMLRTDNPVSRSFPGGLREVADRFADDQVWIRYRFRAPGEASGYAVDGLVPTADGRFVLFPKPWRVFREPRPAEGGAEA